MSNVPKLRFRGFEEEWGKAKINEISHINPKVEKLEENFYYIDLESVKKGSVNKITEVEKKVAPSRAQRVLRKGDVLFQLVRPYQKNHFYFDMDLKKQVVASTGFAQIRVRNDVDGQFLTQLLITDSINKEVTRRCTGTSYPAINSADFGEIKAYFPPKKEQLKISGFLFKLEEKLKLQQEKIELLKENKKGYIQKIFNRELLLKDEDGNRFTDWKVRSLKELVTPVKGNNIIDEKTHEYPILTISAKSGFLNQEDRFSQVIAGSSLKKYTEIRKGDLSYNKGNSKVAKYGCVYQMNSYEKALVPNVYKSFRSKDNINPLFLQYYFQSKIPDKELRKIITSTARTDGLLNVSDKDFYNIPINIPCIKEQNKIAKFINALDKKIKVETKKYNLCEKKKLSLLQQMFI